MYKRQGFRWSPKAGAWQRQLTSNAYYAADYVKAIAPLTGEKPTELQRAHIRAQKVAAQEQPAQEQPENYLKAAEQTTEQNYNMIDGQINLSLIHIFTSLQREANRLFGYTAKQTLDLAQALYEKKLLTYPRCV